MQNLRHSKPVAKIWCLKVQIYRVPNNDSPPPQKKTMHVIKKMKTSTGSPFNSTSLLESPVVSVPSNGATNNLKKEGWKKKETQKLPNICKFGVWLFDAVTCEAKLR